MFNLPLPKKLRSSSVLLPIIIAVLILVVVIEIGLFFTSQNEDVLKERQKDIGVQQYNKLAQEVNNQQEELKNKRPPLIEKCLWVSPKDPNTGIYRLDFIKEKVYDYLYEGK